MNIRTAICLLLIATPGCATRAPVAATEPGGALVVYSETYTPTLGQSEYSAHTDYTIATPDDKPIERVTNATGTFNSSPARAPLAAGDYHVRAQYTGGRFVTFPVVIEPGKTTVVDLDGEDISQGKAEEREPIRLPDGRVVGWRATLSRSLTAGRPAPTQRAHEGDARLDPPRL